MSFCRYELRSTDVDAAREFYAALFGDGFWGAGVDISPVPAAAAARGVPGYWLGHLAVADVVPPMYRFFDAGAAPKERVAWHLHVSRDEEAAFALYEGILGWTALDRHDLGERGRHVTFGWNGGRTAVGSACDMATRPHVHAQWLYFFATPDLDASIARVRELGGLALRPTMTADGHRVVPCDDPQGAAFGLYEA